MLVLAKLNQDPSTCPYPKPNRQHSRWCPPSKHSHYRSDRPEAKHIKSLFLMSKVIERKVLVCRKKQTWNTSDYLLGVGYVYILLVAELGHYCGEAQISAMHLEISKASLDVKQGKY